jgi:hypothetical protein
MNSDRLSPELAAGIVFVIQILAIAVMAATGVMATLPPAAQFLFGLEVIGLPAIVYILIKRRRDRGE